jgi:hypothetical protein
LAGAFAAGFGTALVAALAGTFAVTRVAGLLPVFTGALAWGLAAGLTDLPAALLGDLPAAAFAALATGFAACFTAGLAAVLVTALATGFLATGLALVEAAGRAGDVALAVWERAGAFTGVSSRSDSAA